MSPLPALLASWANDARRGRPILRGSGGHRNAVAVGSFAVVLLLTLSLGLVPGTSLAGPPPPTNPGPMSLGHPSPIAAAAESLTAGLGPVSGTRWACSSSASESVRCTLPAPSSRPAVVNTSGWIPGPTGTGHPAGVGFLVYDARDGYDLLMSEESSGNSTALFGSPPVYSIFENGGWSSITVAAGPVYCAYASLAYDSSDQYVVYWGGLSCTSAGDTWIYHGGSWQNVSTTTRPPALLGSSLSDDPGASGLLWFGGTSAQAQFGTNWTWEFVAGNWTNVSSTLTTSPTAEWWGVMSYDSTDGGVVLVAGSVHNHWETTYATWFFNGSWHVEPAVPVPNTYADMVPPAIADDPPDGYVVLVPSWNGTNASGLSYQYQGGNWTPGPSHAGLVEGLRPSMVFDQHRSADLLIEGPGPILPRPTTTWTYSGGRWTNLSAASLSPSARADMALTYDSADGYVVGFGGCACPVNGGTGGVLSDTWKFASGNWTELATNATPPARSLAGLVYDASDGYVLMFGGQGATTTYNDTWEFTGGGWTHITPVRSPPWSTGATMAYDAADNYVLLVTGAFPASTWTYHAGRWTNLTALGDRTLDGAAANPIVYDSTDHYLVLFGTAHRPGNGATYPFLLPDTWTFRGGNWSNVTGLVGTPPAARTMASVADYAPGSSVLLFGGSQAWDAVSGDLNDTWSYANHSWTELFPAISPDSRTDMTGTYDPAVSADVFFGGWSGTAVPPLACDPNGPCGDTWLWSNGSASTPLVQAFSASPAAFDLGTATHLLALVIGGTPPISYSYSGLPPGCTSANTSSLACTPTVAGDWTVTVLASDAAGHPASAQTLLSVAPLLSLAAFFANPSPSAVGERTLFSVQTANGTAPISYAYTGLPTGCLDQDVPTLPCTPTGSGNFTVHVAVQDAGGGAANGSLNLSVASTGSSGPLRITGYRIAPSTIVLGNSTTISVNATSSSGPLTYAYGNLPSGCTSANASSLACGPTIAGAFGVTISVRDSAGDLASVSTNLTVDPVGGGGGVAISQFGSSPGNVTVGATVVLSVVASGGTGPLTYRYPTLPAGCVSANTSALPCAPSTAGTYGLYVVVSDAAGHSQGAVGALVVDPSVAAGPSVSAFFASPENVSYGNSTALIDEARGTLPLAYTYTGLPPGCQSRDASVLNCTATDVGTFHVTVRATDPTGRSVSATTSFTVLVAQTGPTGPTNPLGPSRSAAEPVLLWAAIGVVVGAVVSLLLLEWALRRRRDRSDGEAIVRALSVPPAPDGVRPSDPPDR
jgi:hypothetical protein